jgi:hypothetical protein
MNYDDSALNPVLQMPPEAEFGGFVHPHPAPLPRTSSGKLSRARARNLYLSGEIQTYDIAA